MNAYYDTTKPRISVCGPDYSSQAFELGQDKVWGEANFWMSIGYGVSIAVWDGQKFVDQK